MTTIANDPAVEALQAAKDAIQVPAELSKADAAVTKAKAALEKAQADYKKATDEDPSDDVKEYLSAVQRLDDAIGTLTAPAARASRNRNGSSASKTGSDLKVTEEQIFEVLKAEGGPMTIKDIATAVNAQFHNGDSVVNGTHIGGVRMNSLVTSGKLSGDKDKGFSLA